MIPAIRHEEFAKLWNDPGVSRGYITQYFKVGRKVVENTRHFLGLPDRNEHRDGWVPLPMEIEAGIAEVQSRWDSSTRRSRETGQSRQAYRLPEFVYDGRDVSFT